MTSIPTSPLGANGPSVQRLGLGLMGLSAFYGAPKPDSERLAFLSAAYDLGVRFWDTADMYGDNEDLLGQWFKQNPEKRKDIFLATKFANVRYPDGRFDVRNDPEYIHEAIDKSLKRLGVDYVDLYYCHRVQKSQPIETTMQTLLSLRSQGKIRHIGLSEISAETLTRACSVGPVSAIQMEYSPWALEIEQFNILSTARKHGVAIVSYSPLGRGFLTGRWRSPSDLPDQDFRKSSPRFSADNFSKNLVLVDAIHSLAAKKNVTPGQLTLAWLISQGNDIFPIPGTTSLKNLKENMAALEVNLTEAEKSEIRKLCEDAEVGGDRYPKAAAAHLLGDTVPLESS